jgi:catechol 2,3-dioxygenase-like lactoylglutathione lyase family enzyme
MNSEAVLLAGAHHVRIPVSALEPAVDWFASVLGYEKEFPFTDGDSIIGWALRHGNGGPALTLIEDPARAAACGGFPLFAFGVPDEGAARAIAARLDERGIRHGGVQPALVAVKLPFVEGPDGILFGFYVTGDRPAPPPAVAGKKGRTRK